MNRRWFSPVALASLTLCICAHALAESSRNAPTLKVGEAYYLGRDLMDSGVREFLGIPFAEPPVGERRWQPPQALTVSSGMKEATKFASACMQSDRIVLWYKALMSDFGADPESFRAPTFSEDCLYLNVWAPPRDHQKSLNELPVYVYVHGGSNKAGWSFEPNYLGHNLASQGIIVVSIAYRLGAFGFLAHPELNYANFALLDMIAALEWVKRNIGQLGGDPNNVTVAGESAGADNIAVLLASPLAHGLFQKAVVQSGGWSIHSMPTVDDGYRATQQFEKVVTGRSSHALDKLRMASADQLVAAAEIAFADVGFTPRVGDAVLPKSLRAVAQAKELNPVKLIVGSNANESLMYLNPDQTVDNWLQDRSFDQELRAEINEFLGDATSEREQLDTLATAVDFGCPALNLAQYVTANGNPTWVYYFNRVRAGKLAGKMGAYHGAELPYIFATHDDWLPTTQVDLALTQSIGRYWYNFSTVGNPNDGMNVRWPEFSSDRMAVLSLDDSVTSMQHPSIPLCRGLKLIN